MNNDTDRKNILQNIWHWSIRHPLLSVIVLSVSLRFGAALYMGNAVVELPGIFDQISYHNLALRVLGGFGFSFGELWWPLTQPNAPTAHWSFLYTFYLTAVYAVFGAYPLAARLLQALLVGILHPYLTYRLAEKVFNRNVGIIAAAVTALYMYFIYYGAALMTEPFYITFILLDLYLAMQWAENTEKRRDLKLGAALGLSIGITVLLRQVFLLFIPFLYLWIWIVRFKRNPVVQSEKRFMTSRRLFAVSTILSLALTALCILPFSLYNQSRFGHFVLLNTNSGYAFFWGNHPIYGTRFIPILPTGTYQQLIPQELHHLDEATLDRELLERGIQFVMEDPKRYVLLSLSRVPAYFMFWYSPDSSTLSNISRIGSFGVMLPFMLYGLILGVRQSRKIGDLITSPQGLLILFAIIYSGIHILTWALIRYRLPVDAVLMPFAAYALQHVVERVLRVNSKERSMVEYL